VPTIQIAAPKIFHWSGRWPSITQSHYIIDERNHVFL
jgi:hypothetical protein